MIERRTDELVDRLMEEVKASQAIEGIFLSQEEEDLIRKRLKGEITEEQFNKILIDKLKKDE